MAEPLGQSGVERIRTHLEVNGNALITFQDDVVAQLRSFAARAGLRHVRLVAPRPQVKTWSSVVDKINRRRRLQKASERRYELSDVNDLVGAKVLCAYLSDVIAVLDWLFRQRSFRVTPTRKQALREMEERERDRGYRGYHFILERRDPTEATFKFELQIKTLAEEAWDAKTHDVSYKPTAELQPQLLDHMRLLSKALTVIDEQSEVLKMQILQEEAERALHQRAAVLIWLSAVEDKDKPLLQALGFPDDPSKFKKSSSLKVLKRIRAKERSAGLDAFLCRCYAILAVLDGGDELKSEALAAADRFGRQHEHFENHKVASYVHWGLGDFRQAIGYTKSAIEMLEGETKTASGEALGKLESELQEAKNQFIYWVCECSDRTSVELARGYLDEIDKESSINTDTWGYFKIVFGDDPAEIEEGRRLIEQACAAATSHEEQVAEVFYLKHEHLAQRRLSEMFSQRVERSLYPYLKGGQG